MRASRQAGTGTYKGQYSVPRPITMKSTVDLSPAQSLAMMIPVLIEFEEKNHVAGSNAGEAYRSLISQNAVPRHERV